VISEALSTLLALIATVPELAQSTGMSVGMSESDPTSVEMTLPAAWPLYVGKAPNQKPANGVVPASQSLTNEFIVMVYLDNSKGQNNMITVQSPILEKVISAVHGSRVVSPLPGQFQFYFSGERLVSANPVRLAYEQRFCLVSYLQ
jgi:hypothetical protein